MRKIKQLDTESQQRSAKSIEVCIKPNAPFSLFNSFVDFFPQTRTPPKSCICYFKTYAIDKVGSHVGLGETGIAEGWNVPRYLPPFRS